MLKLILFMAAVFAIKGKITPTKPVLNIQKPKVTHAPLAKKEAMIPKPHLYGFTLYESVQACHNEIDAVMRNCGIKKFGSLVQQTL